MRSILSFLVCTILLASCQEKEKSTPVVDETTVPVQSDDIRIEDNLEKNEDVEEDVYILSPDHAVNSIRVDLDGDGKEELFEIMKHKEWENYVVIVTWGNGELHRAGNIDGATHSEIIPFGDILWAQVYL